MAAIIEGKLLSLIRTGGQHTYRTGGHRGYCPRSWLGCAALACALLPSDNTRDARRCSSAIAGSRIFSGQGSAGVGRPAVAGGAGA